MSSRTDPKTVRRALPFFVEFVKFSSVFAVLVMAGLLALRFSGAAG
jgi:hypothetical protein